MTEPHCGPGASGVPLTRPQQRMLALHRIMPQADILARAFLLRGRLDTRALASAVAWSARKGPVLSSVIAESGAAAVRCQGESIRLQIEAPDRRGGMAGALAALEKAIAEPFDLSRGPLLRVMIFPITRDEHLFLFHAHHIVVDGYSIGLGLKYVIEGYISLLKGDALAEHAPDDGLARMALVDADYPQSEAGIRDRAYWSAKLERARIPEQGSDNQTISLSSAVCATQLDTAEFGLVADASERTGVTRAGMYAAAFQQVLETVQPGTALSTTFTLRRTASLLRVFGPLLTYGLLTAPQTAETLPVQALRLSDEIRLGQLHARSADTIGPHGPDPHALPLHRTALISFHVQKRFAELSLGYGGGSSDIFAGLAMENIALQTRFVPYGLFLSVGELRGEAAILLVYNRALYREHDAQAVLSEVRRVLLTVAVALSG
jgi:hypothetical protein